jgi:hypothetical protein
LPGKSKRIRIVPERIPDEKIIEKELPQKDSEPIKETPSPKEPVKTPA